MWVLLLPDVRTMLKIASGTGEGSLSKCPSNEQISALIPRIKIRQLCSEHSDVILKGRSFVGWVSSPLGPPSPARCVLATQYYIYSALLQSCSCHPE